VRRLDEVSLKDFPNLPKPMIRQASAGKLIWKILRDYWGLKSVMREA